MITLKTLQTATEQEIFTQVKDHLLKQNTKSQRTNSYGEKFCAYRDENGLKCAAGCLISDDEYLQRFENGTEGNTWDYFADNGFVPDNGKKLIRELQIIHDKYSPDEWSTQLEILAQKNQLKF